jgi:hypothetical protein
MSTSDLHYESAHQLYALDKDGVDHETKTACTDDISVSSVDSNEQMGSESEYIAPTRSTRIPEAFLTSLPESIGGDIESVLREQSLRCNDLVDIKVHYDSGAGEVVEGDSYCLESDFDSTQPPPEIESPRKTLNRLAEPLCDALDANIGKLSLNCDDLVDIEVHTDSDTGYVVEDDSDSLESAGESTPPPPEIGSPENSQSAGRAAL